MNATVVKQSKLKLPGLINILLITVLGISASKFMWLLVTPEKKINISTELVQQTQNSSKQKLNYGKLIAQQHLFGKIKKAEPKIRAKKRTVAKVKAPPPVNLNLKLHGIVSYKSRNGFALISSNNGMQKVFGKGDELKKDSGITVKAIYPDKVVLNNNGQDQDLLLPVKGLKNKSKKSRGNSNNRRRHPKISFGGNASIDADELPPDELKYQSKVDLASFREEIKRNPSKLMDIATTSPAIVDGEFIGFRLQPGNDRKLFRDFGFKANDIITEVNGIVIDSMNKGPLVLGELASAPEISVTVKRGNQILYLTRSF